LVSNGKFIEKNLKGEEIDKDEILMAMREHGIGAIKDIQLAVLETDGSISVVPVDGATGIKRPHRTVRFLKHG
jgi:uncharacterized membrane protein YcaP (DUF421 family)